MIPYIHATTIPIGPLTIHVWGLFVSIAFIVGILVARRMARRRSFDTTHITAMAGLVILATFVGARLFHVFFYDPAYYIAQPLSIFKFWEGGLASFGGYIGAAAAVLTYLRLHRLPILPWADTLIFTLPLGIAIGRLGPFFGHLHPGIRTNFFLAVQYPNGPRLDADFLLAVNGLVLAIIFFSLNRSRRSDGFFLTLFLLWYGGTRFLLDFVRATDIPMPDARYFGLTPAQYGALAFIIIGLTLIFYAHTRTQRTASSS